MAVVEPGVINQDLKQLLLEHGYTYTYVPDPGSQVVSTIGGNVSTNAGGMHCLLSSAVDLEHHQVEVVRRVLRDPIQRYLLGDEVGPGQNN